MPGLMISLVSEQAMPNVMAPLLVDPRPARVLCLLPSVGSTAGGGRAYDIRFERAFQGIRGVLTELGFIVESHRQAVDPYDVEAVTATCRQIRVSLGSDVNVIYNITGGTKLMSLGAYLAAREHRPADPVIYVDSENRRLIRFDSAGTVSWPFDENRLESVTPELYLRAYKITGRFEAPDGDLDPHGDASRFIFGNPNALVLVKRLVSDLEHRVKTAWEIARSDFTEEEMATLRVLQANRAIASLEERADAVVVRGRMAHFNYLSERWLTQHVHQILSELKGEDGAPFFGHCRQQGDVNWFEGAARSTRNKRDRQIDVCAIRGARILLVECKSGDRQINTVNIEKLQVLAERCGRYADTLLLTMDEGVLGRRQEEFRDHLRRAVLAGVAVGGREAISSLTAIARDIPGYLAFMRARLEI
ncbi:MAG TPA: DUF1887 family CARF protein [Candidatus Acidoferrum sp.]|nr:DUF1887 family CARF protein [Candidatus Acidoferrum sp.]